ncbi:MAG: hypothetical protein LAP85_02575 [Acidobacteriia bacterium]|nr:hypothetical protein [Terriglobia bacterium]
MKIECRDMDGLLERDDPQAREALAAHASVCSSCRERLAAWDEISAAAAHLHKEWASPDLWPRIRRELATQAAGEEARRRQSRGFLTLPPGRWRIAAATAFLILLAAIAVTVLVRNFRAPTAERLAVVENRLLTEQALREVEDSEAAYVQSIEKLAGLAGPRLSAAATPLMVSYREKLMLLDEAIAECRATVDQNRYNAHARTELLAMYQQKKHTLQELMKENADELR